MDTPVLHYVYDPLCGWCYAAEPLVQAAAAAGIPVVLHGGGLWDRPVHAPDAKRRQMRATDDRIGQITGQVFGVAYLDGLLVDPDTVWHSRPTVAAVVAVEELEAGQGLAMLAAIQKAHYVDGRRVVEDDVLLELACGAGLDEATFATAFRTVAVDQHIQRTRLLMGQHGLHGFPAFLVQRGKEACARLPHEACYGRPEAFVAELNRAPGT